MEAYPFVAKQLAANSQAGFQSALADLLYSSEGSPSLQRVLSLVNASQGRIASTTGAAIDLDSVPDDAASLSSSIKFVLSRDAQALRETFLIPEAAKAADLLLRRSARRAFRNLTAQSPLPLPPAVLVPLPSGEDGKTPTFALVDPQKLVNFAFPELDESEDIYAKSLLDLVKSSVGEEAYIALDDPQPQSLGRVLYRIATSGSIPGLRSSQARDVATLVSSIPQALSGALPLGGRRSVTETAPAFATAGEAAAHDALRTGGIEELAWTIRDLDDQEETALRSSGQQVLEHLQALAGSRVKPLL